MGIRSDISVHRCLLSLAVVVVPTRESPTGYRDTTASLRSGAGLIGELQTPQLYDTYPPEETMRTWIPVAVASLVLGCVHQPVPGTSISRGSSTQNGSTMSGAVPQLSAATKAQKQECERLLNGLLPVAERMLSEHRQLHPFAIALTSEGRVVPTSPYTDDGRPRSRNVVTVLETGLKQGATSGRYRATALVLDMLVVPPFTDVEHHAIAIRLDHRGGYSVIVFYPYVLGESGWPAIKAPFSVWGEKKIFPA